MEISNVYQNIKKLADDLVEMHGCGAIELETWANAYELVKTFYHTEEVVQIVVRDRIPNV
jgi:hypothetical protein